MTTIKLSKPIEHNGAKITEVTVREPVLGDMLVADAVTGEATKQAAIYASICGVPLVALKQLSPGDYMKIVEAADALAGNESMPETGEPSPA
jgi:hypothetical protein